MNRKWLDGLKILCIAECSYDSTGKTLSIFLEPEAIQEAAKRLYAHKFFLEEIAAVDTSDGLVGIYHFDHFSEPGRVALHVVVPHETPIIPSISGIFKGADWHERETSDFFGIQFSGHPDPTPLLLPEEMDFHPLLKKEDARIPMRDFMDPGDIVEQSE
jgi:NADH-quinone oxidoreductase subunit C